MHIRGTCLATRKPAAKEHTVPGLPAAEYLLCNLIANVFTAPVPRFTMDVQLLVGVLDFFDHVCRSFLPRPASHGTECNSVNTIGLGKSRAIAQI